MAVKGRFLQYCSLLVLSRPIGLFDLACLSSSISASKVVLRMFVSRAACMLLADGETGTVERHLNLSQYVGFAVAVYHSYLPRMYCSG
jgi:hypothetical protein